MDIKKIVEAVKSSRFEEFKKLVDQVNQSETDLRELLTKVEELKSPSKYVNHVKLALKKIQLKNAATNKATKLVVEKMNKMRSAALILGIGKSKTKKTPPTSGGNS